MSSAAAHPSWTTAAEGLATFTDPEGDASGPAPDITAVQVSDDAARSTITISLTARGYGAASADTYPMVKVYLNADRNGATGSPDQLGADYYLGLQKDPDPAGTGWFFASWDGTKWTKASPPTMSCRANGDVITWTFGKAEIGGSTSFAFFAWSSTWDASDNKTGEDTAPNLGTWTYDAASSGSPDTTAPAAPPKVSLLIGEPKTTPARAVAGKRFTVTFLVQFEKEEQATQYSISTGETKTVTVISWSPASGKLVCDPSVAGKVIAHSESFKNSQARLSFVIPKSAQGKLLKVSVKITATEKKTGKTVTSSKVARFRVK